MKDWMLKFSCMMTGDDYQLMRVDTPASKKKVKTLVSVLFLPVLMWIINVFLLMTGVMTCPLKTALLSALGAGLVILIIERSIIMSNGSKVILWIRIILGLLIALLGSLAFDEVIFKNDIGKQLLKEEQKACDNKRNEIDSKYKAKLKDLTELVSKNQQTWLTSLDIARKEADGTGGSGRKGVSDITRLKMTIASQNEKDYMKADSALDILQAKVSDEKTQETEIIHSSFKETALLSHIRAMFNLILHDGWMAFVYLLITAILFVMEFIVVILKYKLPKSNYELKLEVIEEIGKRRMMKFVMEDNYSLDASNFYPEFDMMKKELAKIPSGSLFN